jgi:hypothetical protein
MLRQPPTSPDGNQIPTGHNATAHAGVLAVLLSDSRKARDDLSQSKSKAVTARSGTAFLTDGRAGRPGVASAQVVAREVQLPRIVLEAA